MTLSMKRGCSGEYTTMRDYDDREELLFHDSEEELDDRPGVNWLSMVLSAVVAGYSFHVLAIAGVRARLRR